MGAWLGFLPGLTAFFAGAWLLERGHLLGAFSVIVGYIIAGGIYLRTGRVKVG